MKRPAAFDDAALARMLVLAAIAGVGFGLTIPFLTLVARDRGVSLSLIGLMAASSCGDGPHPASPSE